jgi:hypothetical protein
MSTIFSKVAVVVALFLSSSSGFVTVNRFTTRVRITVVNYFRFRRPHEASQLILIFRPYQIILHPIKNVRINMASDASTGGRYDLQNYFLEHRIHTNSTLY